MDIEMTGSSPANTTYGSPVASTSFGSPPRQVETPSKPPPSRSGFPLEGRNRTLHHSLVSPIARSFTSPIRRPENLPALVTSAPQAFPNDFSQHMQGTYSRKLSATVMGELNDRADKLINSSLQLSPVHGATDLGPKVQLEPSRAARGAYLANQRANRLNTDRRKSSHRYSLTHGMGFKKMESIDSHYAAMRANTVTQTPRREPQPDTGPSTHTETDHSEPVTKRRRTLLGSQQMHTPPGGTKPKAPPEETPQGGAIRHTGMSNELKKVLTLKVSPLHAKSHKENQSISSMRQANTSNGFRSRLRPVLVASRARPTPTFAAPSTSFSTATTATSFSTATSCAPSEPPPSFLSKITRSTASSLLRAGMATSETERVSTRKPATRPFPQPTASVAMAPLPSAATAHTQASAVRHAELRVFSRAGPSPGEFSRPLPRSHTTVFTPTDSFARPLRSSRSVTDFKGVSASSSAARSNSQRLLPNSRSIADLQAPGGTGGLGGPSRLRKMQSMREINAKPAWR